jgi:hypothetical protein
MGEEESIDGVSVHSWVSTFPISHNKPVREWKHEGYVAMSEVRMEEENSDKFLCDFPRLMAG